MPFHFPGIAADTEPEESEPRYEGAYKESNDRMRVIHAQKVEREIIEIQERTLDKNKQVETKSES